MTDDKKHDDKDRKKLSDEKMEDVAGGAFLFGDSTVRVQGKKPGKGKKKDAGFIEAPLDPENFADIEANDTFYRN